MKVYKVDRSTPPPWENTQPDEPTETSIQSNIERFLRSKQDKTARGSGSIGWQEQLKICLGAFAAFVGPARDVGAIDSNMMDRYRNFLLGKVDAGNFSESYAYNHLRIAKQFVKWLWELELIDLPRVVSSSSFSISVSEKRIEVFTSDEITTLLCAASEPLRLYMLLMLNCGMTQVDIATLRHREVNLTEGWIARKRTKTKDHDTVPEVRYALWPSTNVLLAKHRSKHPDLALTNQLGSPLRMEVMGENGRLKRSDNIGCSYYRLLSKLKTRPGNPATITKPLKTFRKTGASKLAEHSEYGRFAQYFLGHSPRSVADKHYVQPPQDAFDAAVRWLGAQFGQVE